MSNISRRKFLKGAGVAALAVAAAGVLAGCSDNKVPGTDVPDVPEVTSETIDVYFVDVNGGFVGGAKTMTVLKGAKAVKQEDIDTDIVPKGYGIGGNGLVFEIKENAGQNRYIKVTLVKHTNAEETGEKRLKKIKITLKFTDAGVADRELEVNAEATDWVHYDDIKDFIPDDVETEFTTWRSELKTENGYYQATNPLPVHLK